MEKKCIRCGKTEVKRWYATNPITKLPEVLCNICYKALWRDINRNKVAKHSKDYAADNREAVLKHNREYARDHLKERLEYKRKWRKTRSPESKQRELEQRRKYNREHIEKIREYERERMHTDINFKLKKVK